LGTTPPAAAAAAVASRGGHQQVGVQQGLTGVPEAPASVRESTGSAPWMQHHMGLYHGEDQEPPSPDPRQPHQQQQQGQQQQQEGKLGWEGSGYLLPSAWGSCLGSPEPELLSPLPRQPPTGVVRGAADPASGAAGGGGGDSRLRWQPTPSSHGLRRSCSSGSLAGQGSDSEAADAGGWAEAGDTPSRRRVSPQQQQRRQQGGAVGSEVKAAAAAAVLEGRTPVVRYAPSTSGLNSHSAYTQPQDDTASRTGVSEFELDVLSAEVELLREQVS
jgi:hypothetical protein